MSNIFQAAEQGDLARVNELLAQGGLDLAAFEADPDEMNVTALYLAARDGHMDVVKALIRAGAPLDVPGEDLSPLHGAVQGSHHDLAAMLLRKGSGVDACRSIGGSTPLSCAKDRRMVALLIAAGADVNAGSYSPLHTAASYGRLDVLQELLSHPDISVNERDGPFRHAPLHFAAHSRRPECVAALLAASADACIAKADGQTPLLYCIANNRNYSKFRIIAMLQHPGSDQLVAAGDRQWAHIPSPCPGLEAALVPVWKEAPQELGQLFSHLEDPVKRRIRAALCTMHHTSPRHLPDHIRMRLLDEAFTV